MVIFQKNILFTLTILSLLHVILTELINILNLVFIFDTVNTDITQLKKSSLRTSILQEYKGVLRPLSFSNIDLYYRKLIKR